MNTNDDIPAPQPGCPATVGAEPTRAMPARWSGGRSTCSASATSATSAGTRGYHTTPTTTATTPTASRHGTRRVVIAVRTQPSSHSRGHSRHRQQQRRGTQHRAATQHCPPEQDPSPLPQLSAFREGSRALRVRAAPTRRPLWPFRLFRHVPSRLFSAHSACKRTVKTHLSYVNRPSRATVDAGHGERTGRGSMTIHSRPEGDGAEVDSSMQVNIAVSRSLGIPLATQIRDQIVAAISVGDLRPGDRLPTIRQLAEFLAINRNTVAQVYRLLEAEGYLSTRAGGGTTVADSTATTAATSTGALRQLVTQALRRAEAAGFTAREFAELAYYQTAGNSAVPAARILVVDEYQGELDFLRATVSQTLPDSAVDAVLLADLHRDDPTQRAQRLADVDFAVVAFYSLEQAQTVLAEADLPILAAGIGPSLHSLRRITEECAGTSADLPDIRGTSGQCPELADLRAATHCEVFQRYFGVRGTLQHSLMQ